MQRSTASKSFFHLVSAGAMGLLLCFSAEIQAVEMYVHKDKYGIKNFSDKRETDNSVRYVLHTWKGWVPQPRSKLDSANFAINRKKYAPTVDDVAKQYKLDRSLLHAVITAESAYDPNAESSAGAVGLMQLMPETAERYGVKDRRNAYENIHGGSRYLRDLLVLFQNKLELAVAAYNAGENAVIRYGNKIPPFPETQNYVKKVLAYYKEYSKNSG